MDGRVDPPSIPTGIVRAGGRPYSARLPEIGQWANQAGVSHCEGRAGGLWPTSARDPAASPRLPVRSHRRGPILSFFDWAGICRRALTSHDTTRMSATPALRPGGSCPPAGRSFLRHGLPATTAGEDRRLPNLETWLAQAREADPDSDPIPRFVERDLCKYLECGILAHAFLRLRFYVCVAPPVVHRSSWTNSIFAIGLFSRSGSPRERLR
jgi:hypothetical protein